MTEPIHALCFRTAHHDDLPSIIALLSDDTLGAAREGNEYEAAYHAAFMAIQAQSGNSLIVAEHQDQIIGVLQLTLIPGLSRGGMLRAQIESVRVSSQHRGLRVGRKLLEYAIEQARSAGCGMVQLTSDKQRIDALRFYEGLGFKPSHEGFKLML
ncbi:GNAT family N-acetyltransferase [Alcaligenaceae bacterium 429]|uniref:GNAT family N-acetyltransferase n=1 Tax=Paenalcaligenes sp. Me52 TaxID=3392038 RepID=UPI00109226D6|nr:GNAT family N-acetyltransferase [Alcaligenaceae bacterium 429]